MPIFFQQGGGGSTPTDFGGLAAAVFTGGMAVVPASGSLPQRIEPAPDVDVDLSAVVSSTQPSMELDLDGVHAWVGDRNNNRVLKINRTTGAIVQTYVDNSSDGGVRTIGTPTGVYRDINGDIWFTCQTISGGNYFVGRIIPGSNLCRLYAQAVVAVPVEVVTDGVTVWIRTPQNTTGTLTEFTFAGVGDAAALAATGRTIATVIKATISSDGLYLWWVTGSLVGRYELATGLTVTLAVTNVVFTNGLPFYGNAWRYIFWDYVSDQPIIGLDGINIWFRVALDVSALDLAVFPDQNYVYRPTLGTSNNYSRSAVSMMPDGSAFAYLSAHPTVGNLTSISGYRLVSMAQQRARYSAPGLSGTIQRIVIPGMFGNSIGSVYNANSAAIFQAEYNWERLQFYYSIDGGATRWKFSSGDDMALYADGRPLVVTPADSFVLDIDYQYDISQPREPLPWVAGTNGDGPVLYTT